jgi:hypothetical protein
MTLACLAACQGGTGTADPAGAARAIEVRDANGAITARVVAGRPCRATVGTTELIVGGRPLVATSGATHWTGMDAPNGTTLLQNDVAVARIHAKQLFDAEGIPLLRVMENGDIANGAGRIVRKARVVPGSKITIGELTITGLTGTPDDLALAAMLTAPEVSAELRALAACHYLLPGTTS